MQKAYLVIHKMALYNDEWYDDFTLEVGAANPAALFATRAEAEAYLQAKTRELVRERSIGELELGELEEDALMTALEQPGTFDPVVRNSLESFLKSGDTLLPETLTDEQLDTILAVSGIQMLHILETETSDFDLALAQSMLALTPERPFVGMEFEYDEENDDARSEVVEESDDPAAQRLNRVTQLFGRKYATGIML